MNSIYVPILKAKQGEFDALTHLQTSDRSIITPWFDVQMLDDTKKGRLHAIGEPPITSYLNSVANNIAASCIGGNAYIDLPRWPTNSLTEHGEHVIAHTVNRLKSLGLSVNPVIDHESWADPIYANTFKGMRPENDECFCIRLSMNADTIDDLSDPDYFKHHIDVILEQLSLDASRSVLLIDFGDISTNSKTIPDLIEETTLTLSLLQQFKFGRILMAGCSLPAFVSSAVDEHNSVGLVVRKEMVAWQAIIQKTPSLNLGFSDYGIRNPSANDFRSKYQNGKIRYTKDKEHFIARGYPLSTGLKGAQYHELSQMVIDSGYYQERTFSWGDDRIYRCSKGEFKGRSFDWVAIDTNHHIRAVLLELYEFNRQVQTSTAAV